MTKSDVGLQRDERLGDRATPLTSLCEDARYQQASHSAEVGDFDAAETVLRSLQSSESRARAQAVLENDLGAIAAARGDWDAARSRFQQALEIDQNCEAARLNLLTLSSADEHRILNDTGSNGTSGRHPMGDAPRVAILSLLFNWPSTGGGTVHTAELGKFLARFGYDVRHIYACFPEWGLGKVTEPTGAVTVPLQFVAASWNADSIRERFRAAVDAFRPDYVIITDSWNTKPLLAEAVRGYRYFLRLAALECLCPLNNVRLLFDPAGHVTACPRQQLATPDLCQQCVKTRGHQSGALHQAERGLAGFDLGDYPSRLRRAFAEAEGVLVVNPLVATMVAPFAKQVHVVPSGFDPERFPWPWQDAEADPGHPRRTRLFFAGLVQEVMKGFPVLQAACDLLWQTRHDFELVATGDPVGQVNAYTRFIGWQSQADLPRQLRDADLLVFPTIAEEALGRSAVEAMGVGRPVIASRIGGLVFTVTDELTGLLFEPGDVKGLANAIGRLLDDPALRTRLGTAGRRRFEAEFTWQAIIDKHYRNLLGPTRPANPVVTANRRASRTSVAATTIAAGGRSQ